MPLPLISPSLLNSASPWATTLDDLQLLFDCPHTGGFTTRTSLLNGFQHDDSIHQHSFFTPNHKAVINNDGQDRTHVGSLNTLGYSPLPLSGYLDIIQQIVRDSTLGRDAIAAKCCIISVTGSAEDVVQCYSLINKIQPLLDLKLGMEVNLSCPNIPDKPPPAYSGEALAEYLTALIPARTTSSVPIGLKTPPYTYHGQFKTLIDALASTEADCPVDFITATNTLGSSLVLSDSGLPAINSASGLGIGGMAGAPLHALALGNVRIIRSMLDKHAWLRAIDVIGVGGVSDADGFRRMQAVGAKVVEVGTALGQQGVAVFERILSGQQS